MVRLSSWGRVGSWPHDVRGLADRRLAAEQIRGVSSGLAYGMGRSYGDACLNPGGVVWTTQSLGRFVDFDAERGRLICEAGVLLRDIQRAMLPRGWSLAVTPGTLLVSVGGAIANDVHGKNHHVQGSFADHVRSLRLLRTDGEVIDCGPESNRPWFVATVGGIGLTGVILMAELQLRRVPGAWIDTETLAFENLEAFFALADASEADWEHTVAWIDCIAGGQGRGIFSRGNHAPGPARKEKEMALRVPCVPPMSVVNGLTLKAFNTLYYAVKRLRSGRTLVHHEAFLYPLDNIHDWNRLYGPRGFYQYQCVIPRRDAAQAVRDMLDEIGRTGQGSFLAVLKTFGERESSGLLGFPRPGVTLAMDFPNRGDATERLFGRLDALVRSAGGAIYLAKDARMPRDLFEAGYPRYEDFLAYRDPGVSSAMSRRLMGY